jgi:HK97 gp10 family phage protein
MDSISVKLTGFEEFGKRLDRLSDDMSEKIIAKALNAMSKPIVGAARLRALSTVEPGSGLLSESITRKIVKRAKVARGLSIIGADMKVSGTRPDGRKEVPGNIFHLVEFGHGGPHPAPPHPILRPAYDERIDEAQAAGQKVLEEELNKLGM